MSPFHFSNVGPRWWLVGFSLCFGESAGVIGNPFTYIALTNVGRLGCLLAHGLVGVQAIAEGTSHATEYLGGLHKVTLNSPFNSVLFVAQSQDLMKS